MQTVDIYSSTTFSDCGFDFGFLSHRFSESLLLYLCSNSCGK